MRTGPAAGRGDIDPVEAIVAAERLVDVVFDGLRAASTEAR
jgi:hypothetical protein